jgi:Ca2+-binding EF-hand superfamily protein
MKKSILTLVALTTLATAGAYAQTPTKAGTTTTTAPVSTPSKKGGDKDNFKEMDKDNDGKLSKVEVDGSDRKHIKKDFATIDTNADGFITKDELKAYKSTRQSTKATKAK